MKRFSIALAALMAAALMAGGVLVAATANDGPSVAISDTDAGNICNIAYTESESSETINTPDELISSITFSKTCHGPVRFEFTSETNSTSSTVAGTVSLDAHATCVQPVAVPHTCHTGNFLDGEPDSVQFLAGQTNEESNAADFWMSDVPPGVWEFRIVGNGNGSGRVDDRVLTVTAFNHS